jgi:hypothetical protein
MQGILFCNAGAAPIRSGAATEADSGKRTPRARMKQIDARIERLIDRIVKSTRCATVPSTPEERIGTLARQKIRPGERARKTVPPKGRLTGAIESALAIPRKSLSDIGNLKTDPQETGDEAGPCRAARMSPTREWSNRRNRL